MNDALAGAVADIARHFELYYEAYVRIVLSALVGLAVGWDRETKSKPAGLKTYMYVCVACSLITLISIHSVGKLSGQYPNTMMDPMRLAAQIVAGLGFLGAGVILKDGLKVKGLTSAAMILFVGGSGIGLGAGFYGFVLFAVLTSMTFARIANYVERQRFQKASRIEHPADSELAVEKY
ncbi:MgtC/SapB family protein [Bacillus sp. FJAT-28004]|uniref:MgtC/SapB family protein n=1 Tax=Bacillus sp. FJAT-28004 TaxID=1679165 RepID=UPI0006B63A7E|nr:MgtC/SapB family protein [Bacillus sp. FJAT-28004]